MIAALKMLIPALHYAIILYRNLLKESESQVRPCLMEASLYGTRALDNTKAPCTKSHPCPSHVPSTPQSIATPPSIQSPCGFSTSYAPLTTFLVMANHWTPVQCSVLLEFQVHPFHHHFYLCVPIQSNKLLLMDRLMETVNLTKQKTERMEKQKTNLLASVINMMT